MDDNTETMRVYQELEIYGKPQALNELMCSFTQIKSGTFTYKKRKSENYANMIFKETGEAACFGTNSKKLFFSTVWLCIEGEKIYVTNIVPKTKNHLTIDEYNDILSRFYNEVILPHKTSLITTHLTNEETYIENILPSTVYEKLNRWEKLCNRDGGICHQYDYDRWLEFMISAYENSIKLDRSRLQQWLLEDRGWGNERIEYIKNLGELYEYGIDLLRLYNAKL